MMVWTRSTFLCALKVNLKRFGDGKEKNITILNTINKIHTYRIMARETNKYTFLQITVKMQVAVLIMEKTQNVKTSIPRFNVVDN